MKQTFHVSRPAGRFSAKGESWRSATENHVAQHCIENEFAFRTLIEKLGTISIAKSRKRFTNTNSKDWKAMSTSWRRREGGSRLLSIAFNNHSPWQLIRWYHYVVPTRSETDPLRDSIEQIGFVTFSPTFTWANLEKTSEMSGSTSYFDLKTCIEKRRSC